MALFAVLMCVNFTACSDSDDEPDVNGENPSTNKLLRSIKTDDSELKLFTYNSKGQLTKVTCGYNTMTLEWTDSGIYLSTTAYGTEIEAILSLKDGIIVRSSSDYNSMKITYDNSKHIIKTVDEDNDTWSSYTWDSNNIISFDSNYSCTYYTDIRNVHPTVEIRCLDLETVCPLEKVTIDVEDLLIAHPNLIGESCKNPIKSISDDSETTSFTYEFDNEGYPTKIIEKETSEYGASTTTTFILTWE